MASRWERLKMSVMLNALGIIRRITLGTRCAVIVDGRVLLVRHGYVSGWQFPGGGVDPRETAETSARREVLEETGFDIRGTMRLFALYHSRRYTNRDHVVLYIADEAIEARPFIPNREIAEMGWFKIDALPDDISPATRARLSEIMGGTEVSAHW